MGSRASYPQTHTPVRHAAVDCALQPATIVILELREPYTAENLTALGFMPLATVLAVEPQEAPARNT
jgi:hypothetical protein